jgi:hypothetical protein
MIERAFASVDAPEDVPLAFAPSASTSTPLAAGAVRRGRAFVVSLATRLDAADRAALWLWTLAHLAFFALGYASAWALADGKPHLPLTGIYERWDAALLRSIAQYGYWGGPGGKMAHPHQAAFFPGYPFALAVVHLVVRNWVASELLLDFVAGAVVVVALTRLARTSKAAVYLLAAPAAVFLMVGYSEALYLALAIPAWSAARRGEWAMAGIYAFFAAATRPDGLFLIPALAVMALTRPQGGRRWRALAGLSPAVLAPLVYAAYLQSVTGRWSAWQDANQAGWDLHWVGPWQSLKTSYWGAWQHPYGAEFGAMEQLEIACLFVMAACTVGFLIRRRWAEAVYCGLAVFALGTSTWYQSVPRTLLVLFPVWVALAKAAGRRRWVGQVYLAVSGPLAALVAALYLSGRWAG